MKKITTIVLLLVVLIGAGIFLSTKNKTADIMVEQPEEVAETPTLPEVRIAIFAFTPTELITKTIINQKFDEKNGFSLVGSQMQPQESFPALFTNRIDLSFTGLTEILNSKANENELIAISEGIKLNCPIFVSADSTVESVKDLAGKKVAVMKKPSSTYAFFDMATIAEFDQTAQDRYELQEVDIQNLPTILLSGAVDGMETCNTVQQAKLLSSGKVKIVGTVEDVLETSLGKKTTMPLILTSATTKWAEANPELINKFLAAQAEALKYLTENSAAMIKETYVDPGLLTETEAAELTRIIEDNGYFNQTDWQEIVNDSKDFLQLAKDTKVVDQTATTDGIFYSK